MEKSSNYISRTSKDYSLYVNEVRGIPRVADGLKDGQRKALWLMRNKNDKIKVIALSGALIAEELYVHGDAAASRSISELAAPYKNNICFLDGIGQFGSKLSQDAFGAPRYVYVKKAKAADDLLFTDLDIVPLMDNYDGSNFSAETFLPLIPTVLLNGISGMGVGWSTDILPHKISDLISSSIDVLDEKKLKKIKPYFNNFDVDITNIEDNSWAITGRVEVIDASTVIIKEIPPGIKIDKIKEHLDSLEDSGKIVDYIDKSKESANIVIKFKRNAFDKNDTEALIKLFKLRTRTTQRIVVIGWDGKTIKTYDTTESVIEDFVNWRLTWYKTRFKKLLNDIEKDLPYYKILKLCFEYKLVETLQSLKSKDELIELIKEISLEIPSTEQTINKIASLPSYKWAQDGLQEVENEINRLEKLKVEYTDIFNDDNKLKAVYRKELAELKKKYN